MSRRPDGALEHEVLDVLWHASAPMIPGQVLAEMPGTLAYTTVMTVLVRLHEKGIVTRTAHGRAYAYEAAVSESELTARRMGEALAGANDRAAAMTGFISHLSKRDITAIRRAMGDVGT